MNRKIAPARTHVNTSANAHVQPLGACTAELHDLTNGAPYATISPNTQAANDNGAQRSDCPIMAIYSGKRIALFANLMDALGGVRRRRLPADTHLVRVRDGRTLARVARPGELIMPARGPSMTTRSFVLSTDGITV